MIVLENEGFCFSCNQETKFISKKKWLRDNYFCKKCKSVPRERAVMYCIENFFPKWKNSIVHEPSTCMRGTSLRLKNEAKNYIPTQYFTDVKLGEFFEGVRSEDLENLSFENASIDLHVTQDVMEHVFYPEKAFAEIARTLKPGGMHIFTVPIINEFNKTEQWASLNKDGTVNFLHEPEYHGNPIADNRSLVTMHWGYDIVDYIYKSSGLITKIVSIDNIDLGIRAKYIDVLVSYKPKDSGTSGINIMNMVTNFKNKYF